jgi:DNA polymerase-3 subunit gamma/tau
LSVTDVRRLWPEVLEEVKNKRRFTWMLLSQNAQVAELRNNTLLLSMSNVGARDHFSRGGSEDVLKDAIVVVLGADFTIETMVDSGPTRAATRPADPFSSARPDAAPGGSAAPAPDQPDGPTSPSSPPEPVAPLVDPALREQVRQGIRPTRAGGERSSQDDRDAAARRDDSTLEETAESHTELLARHLGAEIIAEEVDGA